MFATGPRRRKGLELVCAFGHDAIATPSAELEYVSDREGRFKQPLERCKLLTRWAFEYFDQTGQFLKEHEASYHSTFAYSSLSSWA